MKRHVCMNILLILLASTLIMGQAPLWAQQQRVYSLTIGGEQAGQETATIQPAPDGQSIHVTAETKMTVQGLSVTMKHDLLMTADYQLKQYTGEIGMMGVTVQTSAVVEGDTVVMKSQSAAMPPEEERIQWKRGTVVADAAAYYAEFLLKQYDRSAGGEQQFQVLQPSTLSANPVTVRLVESGTATLNGSPVATECFVDEMMGTEGKTWVAKDSGLVLRAVNPSDQSEVLLQGAVFPSEAKAPAALQDFSEKEVTFPTGKYTLYGTLTLPASAPKPVPGVVFIHGSGPNDRDETIGANKPFRDLAHGLAARRGFASLRYDKRTYTYKTKFSRNDIINLTLQEEVIDDALSAIGFLREQPEIDSRRIFLIGHSLGAWCAPFIAAQDNQLAGIILLAPHAADFDHAFIRQIRYRTQVMGVSSEEIDELINEVRNGFSRLREKTFPSERFLLGASGKYWYDYLSRRPIEVAAGLPQPILVLQGEKDYKTTMDDFAAWKEALSDRGKSNVRSQSFPQLNHLFMPVDGPSTGEEYLKPGTVTPEVIDLIAEFCLQPPLRTR
jgi:dienelactone hydrolase